MIKKFIKHGNSTAIIVDKSLLKVLNIDLDTELKIKTDGKSIIITPITKQAAEDKVSENEIVQKAVEEVMKRYAPALEKLAKN